MKVCVVQPYYSFDPKDTEKCFNDQCALIDSCTPDMDIIVIPEYADVPADQASKADFHAMIEKYNKTILDKARETAIRCNSLVFVNAADKCDDGWRNTTHAIDRSGNTVGKYYKAHPAPSEVKTEREGGNELGVDYSYQLAEPYTVEIEGIRFGFMTCYDFYFYENFAPLALRDIDVIIGCSHQRTDRHEALSIINRFLCYNTNAYLIRSAVSLGEDSDICGCSCIIAPDGEVLCDMKSRIGLGIAEIDPHKKYYKAAGFKGVDKAHWQYIEEGRRPWLYRNGGAAITLFDERMAYPRICAHRGFSVVAPENSMPAFGAAIALGAEEIEFDLWLTADGQIVSTHDPVLERVSDGEGLVSEKTLVELKALDFGSKFDKKFAGLRIATFEEILQKFAGHTVMNIHIKPDGQKTKCNKEIIDKAVVLVDRYDCRRHVYFMSPSDETLDYMRETYPDIPTCCGLGDDPWKIVDRAILHGCKKVQMFRQYMNEEMIKKAHDNGIICNVFYTDDPTDAQVLLDMGVDTILTNNYLEVANAVK
ncbi:MAG: hypothetical protein IJ426_05850 [Clostridia bacterium]|nr:hypothetical protein [Clostridia bacterium]